MRWRFCQRIEHPAGWARLCGQKPGDIRSHLVMRCWTSATHPTAGACLVTLAGLGRGLGRTPGREWPSWPSKANDADFPLAADYWLLQGKANNKQR